MKSGSSAQYSKVPGSNTRQAANLMLNSNAPGRNGSSKPPANTTNRAGPNTRANAKIGGRVASREGARDSDVVMSGATYDSKGNYMSDYSKRKANVPQRTDSAKRRMGAAAAAYHANSVGFDSSSLTGPKKNGGMELDDGILSELGSPE